MEMKAEHINPFIQAVYDMFRITLNAEVSRGDTGISRGVLPNRDIASFVGLTGPARGMVVLSFPVDTALAMVGRMIETELKIIDEIVVDGVGEIVNMVAGMAKTKFVNETGTPIELGLPTVVRGNQFSVNQPTGSVWLEIPFTSDLGPFSLRVSFSSQPNGGVSQ